MSIEQTESEVRYHLDNQQRLESERAPYEALWREIDERVDPQEAIGFDGVPQHSERGLGNFDATAAEGLDRYTAAIMGLTVPRNQRWHGLTVADKDLLREAAVSRWCEHATDRLFACRYAPFGGFEMNKAQDVRHGGKHGFGALWVDEAVGRGLFYRPLPTPEVYFDEDFRGRVDTVHRKYCLTVRQARDKFGEAALTDRMMQAWTADNGSRRNERFEFLHVICPRGDYEPGNPGPAGKRIQSLVIVIDDKQVIRRGGYRVMPVMVERSGTTGAKYGRSPARKVLGTIRVLNEIGKTMLRAGHKAVDPALAFYADGSINRLSTKPGGANPGLVDEAGRLMVAAMPGGGQLPWGEHIQENERAVVKSAFLEELFAILTNPSDRMTATQVLEMVQKQGVLVSPFAGAHETEKLGPMIERELDILIAAGQVDPMPAEMREAGARALVIYDNPLSRMARAEEAAGFTRWLEIAVQIAGAGQQDVFDHVNFDRAMPGLAEVLSVRPSWRNSPEEVAAARQAREQREQAAAMAQMMPAAAGAALAMAKANQLGLGA